MSAFTLYTPRDSGLHRLHPLTKLTLTLLGVITAVTLPGVWPNYAAFALFLLPVAAWGRIARRLVQAVWPILWPFAVSLLVIQGLFWTGGTPIASLGPLSLKQEGVLFAAAMTGRILLLISSFLLLSLATRPDALMNALTARGLSHKLAYVILAAIQIVPRFQAKAETIAAAQQSRGLETQGNLLRRARALLPLLAPLILGSLIDVEERAIALEARGFGRNVPRTSLIVLSEQPWEKAVRALLLLLAVALIAGRLALAFGLFAA
jgi:energy-coupling factor transport system permease protein